MPQHVSPAQMAGTADRRQVTALAYDLVGSTRLAESLDPEDMHELLQRFHSMCTSAIEEMGGKVNLYVGDGGMAYFGYPTAYENAAERAIQAGLAIVERCTRLDRPRAARKSALSVRVGIATSKVVAGDMTGESGFGANDVVGIAPHLAARLQTAAAPNSVLVSDATRKLVGAMFRFGSRHELQLSGFAHLQRAWTVLRARNPLTRFEGVHGRDTTPFLERNAELSVLHKKWERARIGNGQAVLVLGEPGIGKSRVAAEIHAALRQDAAWRLSLQCSPFHAFTPFYPIKAFLERTLLMRSDRLCYLPTNRLNRLLNLPDPPFPEAASVLAHILFPTHEDNDASRRLVTNEQAREEAITVLIEIVARMAARGPLLMIVEDIHWIDPSSLEVLERLISRIQDLPVLLIATARMNFTGLQSNLVNLTRVVLPPLSQKAASSLVQHVAASSLIQPEEIRHIIARAEGNPFFLEELTVAFMERGRGDELPMSLTDVLSARLDQSAVGKGIAQVASVIGRAFSIGLLREVIQIDDERLEMGLARLCDLGVIAPELDVPERAYAFRHSLVQQCAYDSMLKAARQSVHRKLARVLEEASAEPEVLAHHLAEAGLTLEAIAKLRLAGERAASRSANIEAVSLLQRAMLLTGEIEPSSKRSSIELDLCLLIGPLLISVAGPGSEEVQAIYKRAIALSEGVPGHRRFAAHWGWWRTSPNFKVMRERADQLSAVVDQADPHLSLQAHHCQWATLFMLGEQRRCCEHVEAGLSLYDASENRQDAVLYGGHDPKVCGLGERALSLWIQGFPGRSQAAMKACARHAAALGHRASKAHFEEAEINLLHYRRDRLAVEKRAERMHRFAEELGFKDIAAKAQIFGGWAASLNGQLFDGIALIEQGLATQRVIGTQEDFPAYLEMLAEAYGLAGRIEPGLEAIDEAIGIAEETSLRYWISELLRRKGELLASSGRRDEAIRYYDDALVAAEAQDANALYLRVTASKASVFADAGLSETGILQLESALARIPEATPTVDIASAIGLLNSLRGHA